jgi:lipoprotein NlpI
LGYFALQSAQYDKALERFQTILQIDSNYAEAHIYMADVYLSKKDTLATIAALKKYKNLTPDETIKEQIQDYITELTVNKH